LEMSRVGESPGSGELTGTGVTTRPSSREGSRFGTIRCGVGETTVSQDCLAMLVIRDRESAHFLDQLGTLYLEKRSYFLPWKVMSLELFFCLGDLRKKMDWKQKMQQMLITDIERVVKRLILLSD
jgi:hypothetical protein